MLANQFVRFYNHLFCRPEFKPAFTINAYDRTIEDLATVSPLAIALYPHLLTTDKPIAAMIEFAQSQKPEAYKNGLEHWRKELSRLKDLPTEETLKLGYEAFKAEFSPIERRSKGIWYTPASVVNYITRSTVEVCEQNFGVPIGEIEGRILEPAAGIGSFVVAMMRLMGDRMPDRYDDGTFTVCDIDPIACILCRLNISHYYYAEIGEAKPFRSVYCINTLENGELI